MAATYPYPLTATVVSTNGISAARNRLLAEARGRGVDLIAMIDDDEIASPRWLASLVAAHAKFGADVIGGALIYDFVKMLPDGIARSGAFIRTERADGPIDLLDASGNVMLDCGGLARLGWPEFDLAFGLTGGEDKEFFTRLKAGGLRFAWSAEAVVRETVPVARTSARTVLERAYRVGNCDYRIAALHGPRGAAALHLAKSATMLAAALPLAPVLLLPRWRIWLLRRHARALGRIAAAFGHRRVNYGPTISP
jgi:glycosyltransferase involved in cell wall biosynthesis